MIDSTNRDFLTPPNWRELCKELVETSGNIDRMDGLQSWESLLDRARTLLSQSEPEVADPLELLSSPEPIPVSKQLPEPGDCDEKGRCWVGCGEAIDEYDSKDQELNPSWELCKIHPQDEFWLPARSLPIPPQP